MSRTEHPTPLFPAGARPRLAFLAAALMVAAALACGGGGGGSSAAPAPAPPPPAPPYIRTAALSGAEEVPANASTARATGAVSVDPATMALSATIIATGLQGTQAHIHEGASGVSGPVIFPMTASGGNVWTIPPGTVLTAAQYASLQAGNYYFNVHTAANPAGEIRGQITLVTRFATLDGTQEVPASGSAATGTGVLSVNPIDGAASGLLMSQGITGTAAHVHEGAVGVSGPVILPLADAGGGFWTMPPASAFSAAQTTTFLGGGMYGNVHSLAFASGEIRGQFSLASPVIRTAALGGTAEVPANASAATGTCTLALDPRTLELRVSVATTGLVGIAAHIHAGAAGVAGPVIVPLAQDASGAWVTPANTFLTPDQFAGLRAGGLYVNVHSALFPGGEIRGQLPADGATATGGGDGGGTIGGGGY